MGGGGGSAGRLALWIQVPAETRRDCKIPTDGVTGSSEPRAVDAETELSPWKRLLSHSLAFPYFLITETSAFVEDRS